MKGTKNFWNVQIHLQFFRKGSPKSYARMGRAEALVARWLSGAVSAIATQVPIASAKLLLFSDMAMGCPLTCGAVAPDLWNGVGKTAEHQPHAGWSSDGVHA